MVQRQGVFKCRITFDTKRFFELVQWERLIVEKIKRFWRFHVCEVESHVSFTVQSELALIFGLACAIRQPTKQCQWQKVVSS